MPRNPHHRDPIVAAVLGRYAGGHPVAAGLLARRPGHAAIARVWLLGDSYVLRARSLSARTCAEFVRECALLSQVRGELPFQVPGNLATDDGEACVLADGALWTLHRFLPGHVLRPWQQLHRAPDDERRRLVETLRVLHDATVGLTTARPDAGWLVADAGVRYGEVRESLPPAVRARVETALERHAVHAASLAPNEAAFVHGDFHWGNLLVDDAGRVTGMVDLDWCRIASPVEDVAYTAMMLARDCDGGRPRLDETDRVISWYGLAPRHRDALREAMILYALFDVHLFTVARELPERLRYVDCQTRLLAGICAEG